MNIGIIGGGGHVGLPLGLVMADAGFEVSLIDTDESRLARIQDGEMPFNEPGGEDVLETVLDRDRLQTTTELGVLSNCDVIVVVIGTPIDEHQNPDMEAFLELIDDLTPHLHEDQLVVFRSTVYPGTTSIVCDHLEENGFSVGDDIFLAFAPERIAQHQALEEIVQLPQLIGTFDDESYERTHEVFKTFVEAECPRLRPTEAELGKLFTNMWRYLTFAAANEFYLIAESFSTHHDVNIHRILDQTGHEYPRFDVPSPGANVGGPCLTKDGWFLVDNIPYNELVSAAYQINEGMPSQIVERMAQTAPDPEKITILGMTYKTDSDDTRNSVAFKLRKQLRMNGYRDVVCIEPNVEGFDNWEDIEGSDWIILMTPHSEFTDLEDLKARVGNEKCHVCDIWGFWDRVRHRSDNGYFSLNDITETTVTSARGGQ
ncbi:MULTISPECIES: nucleotide sugar dehydrogenase [Haloarcula]|uniref:nucleotide sugar dehydrogenase n=1 Tax=Haloarcula TaxID=2237 RepID=UPI0013DF9D4B|nr:MULTISPECIES: nucleotide sugar dehydrogenase [Haloarcula]NHX41493.1 nucleotide sugar dehydrogenase [Haloarcula sp. R1-2]